MRSGTARSTSRRRGSGSSRPPATGSRPTGSGIATWMADADAHQPPTLLTGRPPCRTSHVDDLSGRSLEVHRGGGSRIGAALRVRRDPQPGDESGRLRLGSTVPRDVELPQDPEPQERRITERPDRAWALVTDSRVPLPRAHRLDDVAVLVSTRYGSSSPDRRPPDRPAPTSISPDRRSRRQWGLPGWHRARQTPRRSPVRNSTTGLPRRRARGTTDT